MSNTPDLKRRLLFLSIAYGVILLFVCFAGVLLSFTAQPGGITQSNALLAPFLGPWSQTLPPNPHPVTTWSPRYAIFARSLAVVLAATMLGACIAPSRPLRYTSTAVSLIALVLWVLAGFVKVLSQLA